VLLLHWSISGASLPTGLSVDQLHEPVLEWAELDALGFDLIIASHIHVPQRLDDPKLGDATMGIYTGSPQPLSHGEGHYQHGVWLAEIAA
jgi:DNA repair exonuclease SbcCD nuclease subunit